LLDSVSILMVEESESDFLVARTLLEKIYGAALKLRWADSADTALDILDSKPDDFFDVVFVGNQHGSTEGLTLVLKIGNQTSCKAPVIFLTSRDDVEIDKLAMIAGATDYLVKQNLTERELERAIRYATNKRQSEARVEHLAFHDPLTGLPNRHLLQDRLEQVLARIKRRSNHGALMFLDLDNFKTINDSLGHSVGDLLLQEVAKRLENCCRGEDTVARLGGDEFVVLLPETGADAQHAVGGAQNVAEKALKSLSETMLIQHNELHITTSIGVTLLDSESVSVDAVLRQADTAMYDAKALGKDNYSFFAPQMEEAILNQVAIENQMRSGLKRDEFYLHYQPILDTKSEQLVGAEALVRWQNEKLGFVSPAEFVPVAEASGLIWSLGEKILEEACHFLARTPGLPQLSVNISSEQIHRPNFVPFVEGLIEETGLEAGRLIFELTETALLQDLEAAAIAMDKLRSQGVRFALDDFGTGYSSLSYLKRLPFNYVKIDHSFTRGVTENTDDQAIIEAVLKLGEVLGFSVTGEGVETPEQLAFLRERDCNTVQGFYFSKPIAAEEFTRDWVEKKGSQSEAS
jgi:diguanylate cyclase (GGDEF)-like protein